MNVEDTNAATLALQALGWIVGDEGRATRLLDLTGLTPGELRASAGNTATLAAVLGFLEGHEPDLIACADAIGTTPAALVAARRSLDA